MTTPPIGPSTVPDTPVPVPEAAGPSRTLLVLAFGLGAFVVFAGVALVLLLLFAPGLRARVPFFGQVAANNAPPEAPDKYANKARSGPVTIEDDFSQASGLWEQSQTVVRDGFYELRLDQPNYDTYGLFLGGTDVRNFDLAVDVAQVAGDPIAEYGIRFRQASPGDHMLFSISGNGFFRLLRVSDESYTSAVAWTRHEAIRTGEGAVNRLRVVAQDATITCFINDQQVLEYRDAVQATGQLTLGLVTFEQGGLAVRFDNIAGEAQDESPTQAGTDAAMLDLSETFADPSRANWSVGGAAISEGSYEVFVGGAVQSWQQPLPTGASRVEGDFVLEVDATLVSGTEGPTAYGIMFGDGGEFDFFTLYLYPEGGIGLFRSAKDGAGEVIVQPGLVDAVQPGLNATNKIKIEARGNVLSVTINDQPLGDLELAQDVSFRGMVGLIVSSGDAEGVRARFDNFRLAEAP